jgi:DNA-directed RNA polymerase subunit M/transcription elongation factor TFIIS
MGATNKFKLQKKLGKCCPECNSLLEVVSIKIEHRGVLQSQSVIKCPDCGYCQKIKKSRQDYIKLPEDW